MTSNEQNKTVSIGGFVAYSNVVITIAFLVLAVAAAGSYRNAFEQREVLTSWHLEQLSRAEQLRLEFVKHEQEWQRILLRGSSSESYYQHLSEFYAIERNIRTQVKELKSQLEPGANAFKILADFEKAFYTQGRVYREALQAYNENIEAPHLIADTITKEAALYPSERIDNFISELETSRLSNYEQINRDISHTELTIGILMLLAILGLSYGIYLFSNQRIIQPIVSAMHMARNISEGDLTTTTQEPKATHEVHQLIQALETMQENIRRTQNELIDAMEEAEKSNEAKSEFLSRMSHELRTPLNAILGFAQLLQMGSEQGDNEKAEDVNEIIRAGKHLLQLINEILDLSRIEQNQLEISSENVRLSDVIHDCISLTAPLVDNRGIQLTNSISESADYYLQADYTRLKQALINFISNAIKYNSKAGLINISCTEIGEDRLRVNVSDSGTGIPEDQISLLFQPFVRIENDASAEGAGIGLALTKKLVELMNGMVGVESRLNEGSTFWLELPRAYEVNDPKAATSDTPLPPVTKHQADEHDYTLLYVEDNPSNTRLVTNLLHSRQDINLINAHTGRLGLDMAVAYKPDLILLDIQLPIMDGYQVLEALKKNEQTNEIPVIAVSANAMKSDIKKGLAAGFQDYITKPLDIPGFQTLISQQLPIK